MSVCFQKFKATWSLRYRHSSQKSIWPKKNYKKILFVSENNPNQKERKNAASIFKKIGPWMQEKKHSYQK